MVFNLDILKAFLEEEGFVGVLVDDYQNWQAIGVNFPHGGGAVEIIEDRLRVWAVNDADLESAILLDINLAEPDCFERVVAALRTWNEHLSSSR